MSETSAWSGAPAIGVAGRAATEVTAGRPPGTADAADHELSAASMAAVLLACGTKGKRYTLPHSRVLIHQPSMSGLAGQATDIDIYAKEILRMRETLNEILANHTKQPIERIASDADRDFILDAEAAFLAKAGKEKLL